MSASGYSDPLQGRLSIEDLMLHSKALEPLGPDALAELARIEQLIVEPNWVEMDVREEILGPLVRVLGYAKGDIFSVEREKKLDFADKRLFIDYAATLWKENFWVIEAKRPTPAKDSFGHEALWQAVQYAIHPEVSAALVVVCDGLKLEVHDREADLSEPLLRLQVKSIGRDIDRLRSLLGPWQTWFWQKRRVIRLLDKVFDHEFNMNRLDEFRRLVDRQLDGKRSRVLDNLRAKVDFSAESESARQMIKTEDTAEIVDIRFFIGLPKATMEIAVDTLIERCAPSSFEVLCKVFPDGPRDTNDTYYA